MARFDMEPRWPQVMQGLPGLTEQLAREALPFIEMMNRRDLNLEDFLNANTGGGGSRWGTIVVAAHDSSAAGKAGADFVATGVADELILSAAVAALPLIGSFHMGRIVLLEGDFVQGGPITLAPGFIAFVLFDGQGVPGELFASTTITSTGAFFDATGALAVVGARDLALSAAPGVGNPALVSVPYFSVEEATVSLGSGFLGTGVQATARFSSIQGSSDMNSLFVGGVLSADNSLIIGTAAGIMTGAGSVIARESELDANGPDYCLQLVDPGKLLLDGCTIGGAVSVDNAGAALNGVQISVVNNTFGILFPLPSTSNGLEHHTLAISGFGGFEVRGNSFGRVSSATPNTYDQVNVASGSGGAPANGIIDHNVFQFRGAGGNHRCDIRLEDAGVSNTHVLYNDTPGGLTGQVCDGGTDTVLTIPSGVIPNLLDLNGSEMLFMVNEAGPAAVVVASAPQDDTLTYMSNEDAPA